MASTNTVTPPHATVDMEIPVKWSGGDKNHAVVDVVLRVLLFVTGLAAIILMVTSKDSEMIHVSPVMAMPLDANWNQLPPYIYFVAAHCVACIYSIITCAMSALAMKKIGGSLEKLQFSFVILDSLLLGVISSAVGAGAAVAYIGIKGNSHTRWHEVCDMFGSFCHHVAASLALSLVSTITLLMLVWLSFYTLAKKIMKR